MTKNKTSKVVVRKNGYRLEGEISLSSEKIGGKEELEFLLENKIIVSYIEDDDAWGDYGGGPLVQEEERIFSERIEELRKKLG